MPRPHNPYKARPSRRFREDGRRCIDAIDRRESDLWGALDAIGEINRLTVIWEEQIVRLARRRGHSWDFIAFGMRTSIQAVHGRWRRRLEGNRYDPKSSLNKRRWIEKYGEG